MARFMLSAKEAALAGVSMKFNPYPVLLTTVALMIATVVFAQI